MDANEFVASCHRVAEGASWLDETEPGWERRVDCSLLNIDNPNQCMCGQVLKDGWLGVSNQTPTWQGDHGFLYSQDGDQWIALIKERFDSGLLSDLV